MFIHSLGFDVFKLRKPRRRVVASLVAAVLVVGVGASTASAVTAGQVVDEWSSTGPYADFYRQWAADIKSGDYVPESMKVAAPSSVITATAPDDPQLRTQSVNQWRANPQSLIDAKNRTSTPTGMTTENWQREISKAGRWQPRLTAFKAIGGGALLALGPEIAWTIRDGWLYPMLGQQLGIDLSSATESTYCVRHGGFVTDFFSSWVGAECAEWRLHEDYQVLVGDVRVSTTGTVAGYTYIGLYSTGDGLKGHCYTDGSPGRGSGAPAGYQIRYKSGSSYGLISTFTPPGDAFWVTGCGALGGNAFARTGIDVLNPGLSLVRLSDGAVIEQHGLVDEADDVEWITRVRCLDGSIRTAVSESYQQEALGGVAVPMDVALDGCQPVGVDLGMQKAGKGTAGGGTSWTTGHTSTGTSGVSTTEVPTEVQDWMRDFPQCWDGSCSLDLKKVIGGTMELDCFQAPDQCVDWREEANADPSKYRCYYAGSIVDLAECNVYGRTFVRSNVQEGTGYSDPKTGETVKTGTGTTTTTNPGAATTAMAAPAADPTQNRQCWPSGWGVLNPFEWVYLPVKCALEWAFVPRDSAIKSFRTSIAARFSLTSFGAIAGIVGAVTVEGIGDGCTGPPLSFKYGQIDETWYPFAACDDPMAGVAATIKMWLGFVISGAAVFAIIRYITATIGYIPYGGSGALDSRSSGPRFEATRDD